MSKLKLSFSFVLMLMLVGMFSAVAFAAGSTTPNPVSGVTAEGKTIQDGLTGTDAGNDNSINNVNNSGSGVGGQTANFDQVIKSDGMVKIDKDGNTVTNATHRTHGEYQNNTNSCASCHQTHTGAGKNLLFKNGEYTTCTACHDGTLGFYNVFTGSDSAGTFGGTHDGNMSVHLANGTVQLKAAPGGNKNGTENWTAEFTCASCHAPHGSYSDRLLHEDPNGMGNITLAEGGKRLEGVPVVADITTIQSVGNIAITDAAGQVTTPNYVLYKFKIGDAGAPTNSDYTTKGLTTGDTVLQLMKWDTNKYVADTDPWLHGYEFDSAHVNKYYWTAFQDGVTTGTLINGSEGLKDILDTDQLKKGEILGSGYVAAKSGSVVTSINAVTKGNIARGYVVKLDISAPDANNVQTTTVATLWASKLANGSTNPSYVKNRGVAMSGFCAACHTDYLAKSGAESGTFDHAYRHTTTSDSYTCVRCHYAHGTDVTIMRDARGLTYNQIKADTTNYFPTVTEDVARTQLVKDYLIDKNPSSALKRYTNMAVCWACHTSSHSEGTRNSGSYNYNATVGPNSDRNGIEFDY